MLKIFWMSITKVFFLKIFVTVPLIRMPFDYDYHGPNQNHLIILKVIGKGLPKLPWFTTFVVDFFFIFSFTLDAIFQFVPRPAG